MDRTATHMNTNNILIKCILVFLIIGSGTFSFAQQQIKWHSWATGIQAAEKHNLPIVVSIYNDNCSWCDHMVNTTYKDQKVIDYISNNFIAIKLNIEEKKPLHFKSKDYNFVKKGERSFHSLALDLLDGRYGTPATIFVDNDQRVLQSLIGYKESNKFLHILQYYGDEYYQKVPWHIFIEHFDH